MRLKQKENIKFHKLSIQNIFPEISQILSIYFVKVKYLLNKQ